MMMKPCGARVERVAFRNRLGRLLLLLARLLHHSVQIFHRAVELQRQFRTKGRATAIF